MNIFGIFKAIDVTVRFDNAQVMRDFEETCLVSELYIEGNIKKVNQVTTVTGGFEDGHVEVTYPIKRNMVAKFTRVIKYYSYFMPNKKVELVG